MIITLEQYLSLIIFGESYMQTTLVRRVVRLLILESNSKQDFKMIFLAGLPGGGKSTLLNQLGIGDQFTTCNVDSFFETYLEDELGTMDIHTPTERYVNLKNKVRDEGYQLTPEEQLQYDADLDITSRSGSLFNRAVSEFREQLEDVCSIGSNFIIDGTSASFPNTLKKYNKYSELGYDCAMILVDISVETSQERNIARGKKGGRSIWNRIIANQGKKMPSNIEKYADLFGPDRFFLVSNKGTFEEYKDAIELIRPNVQSFMES